MDFSSGIFNAPSMSLTNVPRLLVIRPWPIPKDINLDLRLNQITKSEIATFGYGASTSFRQFPAACYIAVQDTSWWIREPHLRRTSALFFQIPSNASQRTSSTSCTNEGIYFPVGLLP